MFKPVGRPVPLNLTRKQAGTRRCPLCGGAKLTVLESRPRSEGLEVRRRIGCLTCRGRFTTVETIMTTDGGSPPMDPRTAYHFQCLYSRLSVADRRAVTRIMRAFQRVGNEDDDGTAEPGPAASV